jgi:DNA-binding transcriptional MerR regulator
MPTFTPSGEDREQVATLSSAGVSLEEIAKGIVNPRTGRPINPRTLQKVFKQELQENLALKKLIIERYKAAVEQNAAWAIKFGMEHIVDVAGSKEQEAEKKLYSPPNISINFRPGLGPGDAAYDEDPRFNEPRLIEHQPQQSAPGPSHLRLVESEPPPPEPQPSNGPFDTHPLFSQDPALRHYKHKTELDLPNYHDHKPWWKRPSRKGPPRKGPLVWGRGPKGPK